MRSRMTMALSAAFVVLIMLGACGKSGESLDVAGLNLGKELTKMVGDATKLIGGISDLESAKSAIPELTSLTKGLDDIAAKAKKLSPESKESFAGMVQSAVPALEESMNKVSNIAGVGEIVRPAMNSFLAKVQNLI